VNWTQIGRFLRTLFLLRVPLLTLALLAVAGPFALTYSKTLLGNLFDIRVVRLTTSGYPIVLAGRTAWNLFSVSLATFLTAFAAVTVINLVIHYGRDRFDDPALDLAQKRPLLTFFCGVASALPLIVCTAWHSRGSQADLSEIHDAILWLIPVLGLTTALLLAFIAKVVQLVLTNPENTPHPPPYLVFPVYLIPAFERFFDRLYCWNAEPLNAGKRAINSIVQWPLEILRCAGQGYLIDCEAPVGTLALRSGHVFALALSFLACLFYLIIGYAKGKIDDKPATVPALAFLLLFGIVLCWILGGLAFFLDRYRVPLFSSIALLTLATALVPQSDHIYRIERESNGKTPWRMQPSDVVRQRAAGGRNRIVLVATAGGGIQAAAWTARVLRGLEEECGALSSHLQGSNSEPLCDFRKSVTLISGVSGGSLGAIAYARSFTDVPVAVPASDVPANAAEPALDEVGWAWTNPDVGRALLPWFRTQYVDRGWALEEKWSAVHKLYHRENDKFLERVGWSNHGRDTFLGDWSVDVRTGMPALLLNATVVEKGQPLIFSSTDFPRPGDSRGLLNFYDLYPGFDIRVNTAARLSASFPYVAPAARSNAGAVTVGDYHVVDGGYYDNYGINSLLGWLEDAISHLSTDEIKQNLTDVLILQIRPFADSAPDPPYEGGWAYQLIAPIDGLLDVRDIGQSARDRTEMELFAQAHNQAVHVWRADFVYPNKFDANDNCVHAPLSWKLSFEQTQCITTAWGEVSRKDHGPVGCVLAYLQNNSAAVLKEQGCIAEADQSLEEKK
jgi:predicted acylesterase/phospholipase RssA